jgi:hypothetical protein
MAKEDLDVWHFVCDDHEGSWTWRRLSPAGEEVARSSFSFRSFNVCVADAELAGFVNNTAGVRRVRTSELHPGSTGKAADAQTLSSRAPERRRRPRHSPDVKGLG